MNLDEFSDGQLMLLWQAGREDAFDRLYGRHAPRLHSFLTRMTGDRGDAEELLQETFLRVARAAAPWEPAAAFTTWLYRIALNRCLTHQGRRSKLRLLRFPEREPAGAPETSFDQARASELRAALGRHVAGLPEPLRAAFVLRQFEGWSVAEAAAVLGCPEGTVKTHVHRARAVLRRRMGNLLDAPAGAVGAEEKA